MKIKERRAEDIKKNAVEQSLETIRNRVDQFGVTEPEIIPEGRDRIVIQLPGIKDTARAKNLIGKTALLEFKLVDEEHSLEEAVRGNVPEGSILAYETRLDRESGRRSSIPILLKNRTVLTGSSLESAKVAIGDRFGEPHVSLKFNPQGAQDFERITGENVKRRMAIVLDGVVYSAPVIQSGSRAAMPRSAARLPWTRKGPGHRPPGRFPPCTVTILEERTVGPSLGRIPSTKGPGPR